MSLIEASKGRTMPPVNRVLAFCYSYDPDGRKYTFNLLKVAGISMFTFIGLFVAWLVITSKRQKA
jgi:protein SCO1/2